MSTVLIILILVLALVIGASFALGRKTYEVDSAKDTEFLDLEGAWVRYNVMGGGPPVVLVHGWLSSSVVWEQLASRLAQRFTVYTLDLTGFGESDKPVSGYGVRYGSRLLYAFCAHFGLTKVNIIGHDLGGDMAVKLASDHPDVVGRIVLVATPANEEQIDLPTPLWAATLPVVGPVFYALGRAVRPVRNMWMSPFVSEPSDVTEEMLEDAASSTPAAMSQTLTVSRREIGGGRLARQARIIKAPALVIAGEEDQIVDPQAAGEWARSLSSAEVCLMDECGHMPMIERPGEFNAQILAFLTGDARYLEYAEQRPAETTDTTPDDQPPDEEDSTHSDDPVRDRDFSRTDFSGTDFSERDSHERDFSSEEVETGGDTRRFHIRPEEGEAPAFGAAPEDDDSGDVWSPSPGFSGRDDAPKDERGRGLREELEDTGGVFGRAAGSGSSDHRNEPGNTAGSSDDFAVPGDGERRERIDRSRYDDREEPGDPDNPDDEGEVRSFRDRLSGRGSGSSSGRRSGRSGRRMTFGGTDGDTDGDTDNYSAPEPREEERETGRFTGQEDDFSPVEDPRDEPRTSREVPDEQPRPRVRRRTRPDESEEASFTDTSLPEVNRGTEGAGGEHSRRDEAPERSSSGETEQQPSESRRRPRRESGDRTAGEVPEVPPGLFDWGDSLDVFQPPARDTGNDSFGTSRGGRENRDPDTPDDDDPFSDLRGR